MLGAARRSSHRGAEATSRSSSGEFNQPSSSYCRIRIPVQLNRSKFLRAMPTLFKMSDNKKTEDAPAFVYAETKAVAPPNKTKRYAIIAVTGIAVAAIILTAILVGMYMFTKAQLDIIKYTTQLGEKSKQDVTSDPNENVVQYHVSSPGHDAYIVNDFNKDLQLVKIVSDGKTNCYLSALNRTNAMDPSKINGPQTQDPTETVSLMYQISDTPIVDSSFLGKTARETCKGISVYWLYPYCDKGYVNKANDGSNVNHPSRKRRDDYGYYCVHSATYHSAYDNQNYTVPCVTGCCKTVCACNIDFSWYAEGNQVYCNWNIGNCPPQVPDNPVYYDPLCNGASYTNTSCGADHNCLCS